MSRKRILDVTLRETPTFFYGQQNIKKTLKALENTGIDIIECAYLGDESAYLYQRGSTHINKIEQANDLILQKNANTLYTVCMNGSSYDLHRLSTATSNGIDAIRYVLMEDRFNDEIDDLKLIKEKGYRLIVQHRNIIAYSQNAILNIIRTINEIGADAYSIVDTHGVMYQQDIEKFVELVSANLNEEIWLGFHGHNNHMLATANSEAFLRLTEQRKDVFVDGSIMGVGIGAGNANTELLALYCNKMWNAKYSIEHLYDFMDTTMPDIKNRCSWGYSGEFLISAEYNAMISHTMYLRNNLLDPTLNHMSQLLNEMPNTFRYNGDIGYWERYAAKMKKDSKLHSLIRLVKKMKILTPMKHLYHVINALLKGK